MIDDDASVSDVSPAGDAGKSGLTLRHLVQVDIHENATVRVDVFEPCRVTVSPEEGFLCLTRYKQP